ncbi:MAG: hypothetical protein M9894_12360 [Planctomycetes bacterium]|nr:hypothetical protein [Planctomycetota bacterium]
MPNPTVEQEIAAVEKAFGLSYGINDVFEESTVTLAAKFTRGKSKSPHGKWIVTVTKPKAGTTVSMETEVKISNKAEDARHQVKLEKVDDTEEYYILRYAFMFKDERIPGPYEFKVWPRSIKLKATINAPGLDSPRFKFNVIQGETAKEGLLTEPSGEATIFLDAPGRVQLTAKSPWKIDSWTSDEAVRARTCDVSVAPITALIHSHTEGKEGADKPLKVYVNEDDGKKGLVKVEVGAKTLADGLKGQKIKVKVTFPADNGKVTDPAPALWTGPNKGTALAPKKPDAKPGVDELVYEHEVELPTDGGKAAFYVQLGVCGGDKCTVQVGVTDSVEDDKLHLVNARKVVLELLVAKPELRQKCSSILADSGAALAPALMNELKRVYQDMHIEFEMSKDGCVEVEAADFKKYLKGDGTNFTWPDILKPELMFIDAAKFANWDYDEAQKKWVKKTWPSGKLFLMTDYQRRKLRDTKLGDAGVAKTKNTMTWIFCDYIADRASRNAVPAAPQFTSDMASITNQVVHVFEGKDEDTVETNFLVFDYDPIEASGALGVKKVNWRIQKYRKKGEAEWRDVAADGDPGGAYRAWQTSPAFANLAAAEKWVQIVDAVTLKMKLPKDTATSPGNLLKIKRNEPKEGGGTQEVEYETKIQAVAAVYGVSFSALGGAVGGAGQMRTSGGLRSMQGTAKTLAHEIAHNLGHGYSGKAPPDTGGRGSAIPGIAFGAKVPDGHYYVGHGHTGCHCAKQLMDLLANETAEEKAAVCAGSFSQPSPEHQTKYFDKLDDSKHCVIWGSGPESPTHTRDFCDDCKTYIKSTDCSDVTKAW